MSLSVSDAFALYDEKIAAQSYDLDAIYDRINGLVDHTSTIAEKLSKINERMFGPEPEKENKVASRSHGHGMIGGLNAVVSQLEDLLVYVKTRTDQLERL